MMVPGLVLIGYRGTGKSTVGRIVAGRLGRPFLDADREIEARAGRSIASIFAESGEPAFRDWEERTLAELTAANPGAILATGGGAVLREANRRRLRAFGFVAWLTADPAELARRLEADRPGLAERPALTTAGTLGEIARVLAARTPLYAGLADAIFPTDGRPPCEVAEAILESWLPIAGPN
ncbi:MAG TPA: shikimate kinase, partial [Acidimicrobiales bacterium]|nr:shikimate kinase [Acidimicrobiales bacterium]